MVRIVDAATGDVVAAHARLADNPWTRFRGLMLHGRLGEGEGLDIRPCSSIHMMFMLFSIDAVFYDREGKVTKVARRVRPWIGLAFGGRGAKGVVELPVGAAAGVEPGHQLEFVAEAQA
jgi:uncharacterized membrane protein (UPF0127 family)